MREFCLNWGDDNWGNSFRQEKTAKESIRVSERPEPGNLGSSGTGGFSKPPSSRSAASLHPGYRCKGRLRRFTRPADSKESPEANATRGQAPTRRRDRPWQFGFFGPQPHRQPRACHPRSSSRVRADYRSDGKDLLEPDRPGDRPAARGC